MSHIIIDRTLDSKKSSANRSKFIRRASQKIKEAVKDYIANEAEVQSIASGKDKKVRVSGKSLDENAIVYGQNRDRKQVVIGNKDFVAGDTVPKPSGEDAPSSGRDASDSGEGEDDFYFTLTHKEFVDIFFEDLELPDMIKKQLTEDCAYVAHQAGFSSSGPPVRLDLRKTLINSYKRTAAVGGSIDRDIEALEERLLTATDEEKEQIELELEELRNHKDSIPFLEELDLRYKHIEMIPQPTTKAVMFCILDVSGSMTDWHKEIAKRFFMILYLFLTKQYENVQLVFIKHHHEAFEVDEQDFFYSRLTGGTIVSSALELTLQTLKKRYPTNLYNAYVCQVSDGDNINRSEEMMKLSDALDSLMPLIQYFAFVDVKDLSSLFMSMTTKKDDTVLMAQYKSIIKDNPHFANKFNLRSITDVSDIYAVFRSLFSKYKKEENGKVANNR